MVTQEGKRKVELRALVVNESRFPLRYEVRFVVECADRPAEGARSGNSSREDRRAAAPVWSVAHKVSVRGGPVAPGASELVKAVVPYELLEPGKMCRYRATLANAATGAVLASAVITSLEMPLAASALAGAAFMASAAGAANALTAEAGPASVSGVMAGTHEARRVGNEWIERGSGTINVAGALGRMILSYTYNSHGPSAASLTATATGSGTLTPPHGTPMPVQIASATAQITAPGARQEEGAVITRSGAQATGTFSGTMGGRPWTGVLTMTDGVMTWSYITNTGTHRFNIRFTATR
jgi:hypothetical protein